MNEASRERMNVTTHPRQSRLTADAFIAWAGKQPRGRYELVGGEVVAMAPERAGHTRVKFAVTKAFEVGILEVRSRMRGDDRRHVNPNR